MKARSSGYDAVQNWYSCAGFISAFEGSPIHSSSRHRVVGTTTRLWPRRSRFGIPTDAKTSFFFKKSRPTLRPTKSPVLKVPRSSREWWPGLSVDR